MNKEQYFELIKKHTPRPPTECTWDTDPSKKLCLMYIEFRDLDVLECNLWNLANVYGGKGPGMVIVCGDQNHATIKKITAGWKGHRIVNLVKGNVDIPMYNKFLTSPKFYKDFFGKYEHMLVNQWDSYLFREIPNKFFNYDYVGAPTGHFYVLRSGAATGGSGHQLVNVCRDGCECGNCRYTPKTMDYHPSDVVYSMFNGGFSLRRVKAMIDLCNKKPHRGEPEDVYFCISYLYKPSRHEAMDFAVQDFDSVAPPVGCHKIWENKSIEYVRKLYEEV